MKSLWQPLHRNLVNRQCKCPQVKPEQGYYILYPCQNNQNPQLEQPHLAQMKTCQMIWALKEWRVRPALSDE